MVAVDSNGVRLLQIKKDAARTNPGRKRTARIHRPRSAIQKALGVEMVYVNPQTNEVWVTEHQIHNTKRNPADRESQ